MNTPQVRPPTDEAELERLAELIDRAFGEPSPVGPYRSLVQAPSFEMASLPAVWSAKGEPLSVVQAVPCRISLLGTWVPGGIITMVATAPDARGKGYMRACMLASHQWLRETGHPLGILFGIPNLYPKFGYRPVMPGSETSYSLPKRRRSRLTRLATSSDLESIATLFNAQALERPCAIFRPAEPWVWEEPAGRAEIHVIETRGEAIGYLRFLKTSAAEHEFVIIEAACHAGQEPDLLDAAHSLAQEVGRTTIRLRLMPDHPLVSEVTRRVTGLEIGSAAMTTRPPQAGMLSVLDYEMLVEQLRGSIEARLGTGGLRIVTGDLSFTFGNSSGPTLHVDDPADLAHVIAGYPGIPALRQWGRLHGDNEAVTAAMHAFPTTWPRWSFAPYWGE